MLAASPTAVIGSMSLELQIFVFENSKSDAWIMHFNIVTQMQAPSLLDPIASRGPDSATTAKRRMKQAAHARPPRSSRTSWLGQQCHAIARESRCSSTEEYKGWASSRICTCSTLIPDLQMLCESWWLGVTQEVGFPWLYKRASLSSIVSILEAVITC